MNFIHIFIKGPSELIKTIDGIQTQMFGMVCQRVLLTDINKVSSDSDRKIVAVGVTKILCECPQMIEMPYIAHWQPLFQALIGFFELPPDESCIEGDTFIEIEETSGYQVAYSQLNFASVKKDDPVKEVSDVRRFLLEKLRALQKPEIKSMIQQMPAEHLAALQKYASQTGISL